MDSVLEEGGDALRFIKKIPPSGGPPSYKLTLPHQIVHRRLQHLVDTGCELASSVNASQTWQGSIAPRRNKDRSEYILQGWKLFAEAHNLLAGDQVSFELVGSRRLVVKCIQACAADKTSTKIRNASESPEATNKQPVKSQKSSDGCSPSRQGMTWHDEPSSLGQRSHSLQPVRLGPSLAPIQCHSPDAAAMRVEGQPMAQRVQSWLSLNLPSPQASPNSSASKLVDPIRTLLRNDSSHAIEPVKEKGTSVSHLNVDLPGIFDDMCQDLDSVVPDVPPVNGLGANDSSGLCPLRPSLAATDFTHHLPQAPEVQPHETELRALVSSIQDRLDQSTRSALQATMGLENCAMDMSSSTSQKEIREVQAKMFRHLSFLKESLWQVLLVSNDTHDAEMS